MRFALKGLGLTALILAHCLQPPGAAAAGMRHPGVFRIMLSGCGPQQDKGFVQTGFRADWRGQKGIVTALHGVAGCQRFYAAQEDEDGRFEGVKTPPLAWVAVDTDRDVAFLRPENQQLHRFVDPPLQAAAYDLHRDRLTVRGYPDGSITQFAHSLEYHENPLRPLGSWHLTVKKMCSQRGSPDCDREVLLVRGDALIPGHSGAPVFNQDGRVVGIAGGGLKEGVVGLNWIVPYADVRLTEKNDNDPALIRLRSLDFLALFAAPSSMDDARFPRGTGATISGHIRYGGYGSPPLGPASDVTRAFAAIQLMDTETRTEVPVDFSYDNTTGSYSLHGVPSGKFTPFVRLEAGYPFHKKSAGDFVSHLSGLNGDIVVAPHDTHIQRDLNVVKSIHLKRPLDNQRERTLAGDPPEVLYRRNHHPSAAVFEWEPVPGATRYEVRILLMDAATDQRIDQKIVNTDRTSLSPDLEVNRDGTYYMFLVYAYKGSQWSDLIGEFTNYYRNGHGGWIKFRVLDEPEQASPQPKTARGYLVVFGHAPIGRVEDLKPGDGVCASKSGADLLRTFASFSGRKLLAVPAGEVYTAMERGVCRTVFVSSRESARKLFPPAVAGNVRFIAVYGD